MKLTRNNHLEEQRIDISATEFKLVSPDYTKYLVLLDTGNEALHRLGGLPALEYRDGSKWYYEWGRYHRANDLPAIDTPYIKAWLVNGKAHRDGDLPAYIGESQLIHYKNDTITRLNGPAVFSFISYQPEYWLDGVNLTEKFKVHTQYEFENYLNSLILE